MPATKVSAKNNRSKKKAVIEPGAPNIQFVGRRKLTNGKFEPLDAPAYLNTGQRRIDLPDGETQKKGFYLPPKDARAVRAEYPTFYKEPKKKGLKREIKK